MNLLLRRLLVLLSVALLAACSSAPMTATVRDTTLSDYGAAIRWSEFDTALQFIDPALRAQQPLSELERERLKHLQVTGYEVKTHAQAPDLSVVQTVEIRLINRNTQIERTVTDHQAWRWDEATKHLWLTSGLPDFEPKSD